MIAWTCERCGKRARVPDGLPVRCSCGTPSTLIVNQDLENPSINIVAVSTFKPDGDQTHQSKCVRSWKRFGLNVQILEGKRPSIAEMVSHGRKFGDDVLLINSDIEAYGSNAPLQRLQCSRRFGVGIRWNYDGEPRNGNKEQWGLDVFFVPSEIEVPEDNLLVGYPLWDYWLPWHVTTQQLKPFDWIGCQLFFHRKHALRWTHDNFHKSVAIFEKKYPSVNWVEWRNQFDPLIINGRLAWKALHEYPLNHIKDWNEQSAIAWYQNDWFPLIPRYNCECASYFAKLPPPTFESPLSFALWGIDRHNDINIKLRKPTWPSTQAEVAEHKRRLAMLAKPDSSGS